MTHQPMPDCPACAGARERLSGEFRIGCTGCCARAAARSPQFRAARDAGQQTRSYRALLVEFGLTHEQVREAHAADFEARAGGSFREGSGAGNSDPDLALVEDRVNGEW